MTAGAEFELCRNRTCPSRFKCLRYIAAPMDYQRYGEFNPGISGKCRDFVKSEKVFFEVEEQEEVTPSVRKIRI